MDKLDRSLFMSDLNANAVALHEFFKSLIAGGFTEGQAIKIIATTLATSSEGGKNEA